MSKLYVKVFEIIERKKGNERVDISTDAWLSISINMVIL